MLERKIKREEIKIPSFGEFDLSKVKSDLSACGLNPDHKDFEKRNGTFLADIKKVFDKLSTQDDASRENILASVAQAMERNFSTREITFLLAKGFLDDMMTQKMASETKQTKTQE